MRPSTLISMGLSGRALLLLSLRHLSRPFYRLLFVASASRNGILRLLADGPPSLGRIATALGVEAQGREARDSWLEVGCGSAVYLRHATSRNPDLTALGIDVDQAVVDLARERVCAWGLADRARVELGDILDVPPRPEYDLVTLHNGIYYFPVSDRVSLLEHPKRFVRPGGRILLTTNCRGRGAAIIETPDMQESRALARKVRGQARRASMKRSDVKKAVRATRRRR
jgi:SAM-dependent methyltransferase